MGDDSNAECGVRSAEPSQFGVRSHSNAECGVPDFKCEVSQEFET